MSNPAPEKLNSPGTPLSLRRCLLLSSLALLLFLLCMLFGVLTPLAAQGGSLLPALLCTLAGLIPMAAVTADAARDRLSPRRFFLTLAIPLGLVYLVLFPPWTVPDAPSHYLACYRLTNLLLGLRGEAARMQRSDDLQFFLLYFAEQKNPDAAGIQALLSLRPLFVQNAGLVSAPSAPKMDFYSLVSYLPLVLGMALARLCRLGTVPMLHLGRFFLLAAYILCISHAIHITPKGKWLFALLPLLPMGLMISCSYSYDGMLLLCSLCFIASLLRLKEDPEKKASLAECLLWIFLLGGVKGGGALYLLLLVLLLAGNKSKRAFPAAALLLCSAVCSFVLFELLPLRSGDFFQMMGEDGYYSAAFALHAPLEYLRLMGKAYLLRFPLLLLQLSGSFLGWLEYSIPIPLGIFMAILVFTGTCFDSTLFSLSRREKLSHLLVFACALLFTPVMLLSFTPVGSSRIMGLQGRYYLPCAFSVLLLLANCIPQKYRSGPERAALLLRCSAVLFAIGNTFCVYFLAHLYLLR